MKKRVTFTVDEDVFEKLKYVPRGFSVSEFVSFMLKGMLEEVHGGFKTQEDFNKWVNSDPELKKVREGLREAWGPSFWKAQDKVAVLKKDINDKISTVRKKKT